MHNVASDPVKLSNSIRSLAFGPEWSAVRWVSYRSLQIYLRKTRRWIRDENVATLEWANLSTKVVPDPAQVLSLYYETNELDKDASYFMTDARLEAAMDIHRFCIYMERICTKLKRVFFVENVMNPRIAKYLRRRKYDHYEIERWNLQSLWWKPPLYTVLAKEPLTQPIQDRDYITANTACLD